MFNNKGLPNSANWSYSGRMSKLPPRIPLPSTTQASTDRESSMPIEKRQSPLPNDNRRQHQRTSSESFIVEEQPSWFDDLLNEPETPFGRGTHRRSSSDSVAYLDILGTSSKIQSIPQHEFSTGDIPSYLPSPVSLPFDMQQGTTQPSSLDVISTRMHSSRGWESSINLFSYQPCAASMGDVSMMANFGQCCIQQDMECFMTEEQELENLRKNDHRESSERRENLFIKSTTSDVDQCDQKACFGRKEECSHGKHAVSDADPKRTKQHFAQRSRVRKLQYIAELERIVSLLHAEGSDVAAEVAFLKQQHLTLSLENKVLMQRITRIAHEKQIKDAQYELLRKEVDRLREVYCNQKHERPKPQQCGCDDTFADAADQLDLRFSCLSLGSLNHLETRYAKEPDDMNRVAPYPCMMLQNS